jgi:NAD-dependent SIR2 family protein deacetylase
VSELDSALVAIARAAEAIRAADALLIGAGAGLGVDSGLPDFRGPEGFWRAYPLFRQRGLRFEQMSNPVWFRQDPRQAWGFFGHRLKLYRGATPHDGFAALLRWAGERPGGYFVFTSNVDGHFQRAGFDPRRVVECHGSIHFLQCEGICGDEIWPADDLNVEVDLDTIRATSPLPSCSRCSGLARPNILMFGDWDWCDGRTAEQLDRYADWLAAVERDDLRLVVIELGAGTAVPTVRHECERRATWASAAQLIRINPRDDDVPPGGIAIPLGALEALRRIEAAARGRVSPRRDCESRRDSPT